MSRIVYQEFKIAILTINFIFKRCIWMKYAYCMDKFFKFNNIIFLFIKKIKNLQGQEKENSNVELLKKT